MAGSQLKNLKAALKAHGLTGQTNVKNKKKNRPRESDREEKQKVIESIRTQFNPFEVKVNRTKKDSVSKFTQGAVGKPGISKQVGEDQRKAAWEAKKASKNKVGGVSDRRFGENNKNMSAEEKMLARFTRERQHSSKKSLFNLDDSDVEEMDEELTHFGKSLSFDKRAISDDEEEQQPARKKTKAEVMKEIIAKSKYYKQERQRVQQEVEDQIDELDEDFDDILSELQGAQSKAPAFSSKSEKDIDYDQSVKALQLERRAAPADRTKTEEELQKEHDERIKKLEQDRINRMNGVYDNNEDGGVEDLGDDFWINDSEQEGMESEESEDEAPQYQQSSKPVSCPCPQTHEELLEYFADSPLEVQPKMVEKVLDAYKPRLAAGNKEKVGVFAQVLLQHVLYAADQEYAEDIDKFTYTINAHIATLKGLASKYNQPLAQAFRTRIASTQRSIKAGKQLRSDIVFFSVVGYIFSTSDHYHLVVTPSLIIICEALEQMKLESYENIVYGALLAQIALQYQRISKRYMPELTFFLEKALCTVLPQFSSRLALDAKLPLPKKMKLEEKVLKLSSLLPGQKLCAGSLILNLLDSLDRCIDMWKETNAFIELVQPFQPLLVAFESAYSVPEAGKLAAKITQLLKFQQHVPLTLQAHKPMAIPTYAPKYEENFNPDKKSYDPDRTRQEIGKMKAQIKKERKMMLKEIRKDTRFEGRQQIAEKKAEQEAYHKKMAHIVNTINTEEGAEKNKYEREKKLRNTKK